jgi:rhamnosyltransferase subunit B
MSAVAASPKIVIAGIGTKGDLFPLLALGRELVQRGYEAQLLGNDGAGALAASYGLGFTAVTVEQTDNTVSTQDNLDHHVFPSYGPTADYFREQISVGQPLVVVNSSQYCATNAVCEKYGLAVYRIHLAPSGIRSLLRPPWPYRERLEGPLAATFRKYFLPTVYAKRDRSTLLMPGLNQFRAGLGLAPVEVVQEIDRVVRAHLGFFPSWYAEPAADWPQPFELSGFPLPATSAALPSEFVEFVQREGRPIVFTPGTGVPDVQLFFEQSRQCCEALGLPGVFLSPHFRAPSSGLGSRIRHFEFLDLQLVLQHSALLVHHGGIGTTARAFQAAVPQIIRARMYDQPDNGDRVTRLGVGRCLFRENDTTEALIAAARQLTSSAEVQQKLAHFRAEIAGSDAVAHAADWLERYLMSEAPAARRAS